MNARKKSIIVILVVMALVPLALFALARWRLVVPRASRIALAEVSVEVRFDRSDFLESVRQTPDGTTWVAKLSPDGNRDAFLWSRDARGVVRRRAGHGNNLAVTPRGSIVVSTMTGTVERPAFILESADGDTLRLSATFDPNAMINGLVADGEATGFAADSRLGCIWRWEGPRVYRWRCDPRFAPASLPGIPGINGLRATDRALLTVNSSTGQLLEVPLHGGTIVVLAADLPGDGLAVGADGSVFVVTHPFNTIERIAPGGARTTIGSSANGVWGPTDIDVLPNGDLLVVQDGGGPPLPEDVRAHVETCVTSAGTTLHSLLASTSFVRRST